MKPKRVPKRAQRIVEILQRGQRLCKSVRLKETGVMEVKFYFEPSGRSVGPRSAQAAIASGLLRVSGDGLFDGFDQTWSAA